MKQVIGGLLYNTETATEVCHVGSTTPYRGDFAYWTAILYRTPKKNYFLYGKGNAQSRFAETTGQNQWSGGSGIRPVDEVEAKHLAEGVLSADAYAKVFGPPTEA